MKQNVMLLTATVTPPAGAAQLLRIDPQLRLMDYAKALAFYIEHLKQKTISSLIFVDNSNSDISVLKQIAKDSGMEKQIEFISFAGLNYPQSFGRGYGEFMLIDYAMNYSSVIAALPETAKIWKITGRYILQNIEEIIDSAPASIDFYCNCRNIPEHWIDLYVLCWSKVGHRSLLMGIFAKLKEGQIEGSAEHHFRRIVDEWDTNLTVLKRFRKVPILEGIRGLDNQSYANMRIRLLARRVAAAVVPWLWI